MATDIAVGTEISSRMLKVIMKVTVTGRSHIRKCTGHRIVVSHEGLCVIISRALVQLQRVVTVIHTVECVCLFLVRIRAPTYRKFTIVIGQYIAVTISVCLLYTSDAADE